MRKLLKNALILALVFVTVFSVVYFGLKPRPPDLSNSEWIFAAIRSGVKPQEADHRISAAFRWLYEPLEFRYEIVYASRTGVVETRDFYQKQLTDPVDTGDDAVLRLSGKVAGETCTVRNYYSKVANIYCLTLTIHWSRLRSEGLREMVKAQPVIDFDRPDGPFTDLTKLKPYGNFIFYNLDPLDKSLPLNKPVQSAAWVLGQGAESGEALIVSIRDRAGLRAEGGKLVGTVEGLAVEVATMRTDLGVDLITVRFQ